MCYLSPMNYTEAKSQFIQTWGTLGSQWGINKTMAQIHALLMISPNPLSVEEIMDELRISRGNTSMNVRGLIDWGIVRKVLSPGERREYFTSEKEVWKLATRIANERRRRELAPMILALTEMQDIRDSSHPRSDVIEFNTMTKSLLDFSNDADRVLSVFVKNAEKGFFRKVLRWLK